ncbi:MAG TPA: PilZ domain-containing protein [Thermoanaerobaculia bacterium]|nr:PilZ domain-containing protein [Thermoanaerobaculia bacterium]
MANRDEKRRTPRVPIARGGHGRVKAAVPVTVIDVSRAGMLLELAAALRPGSVYDLSAQLDDIALSTQVRITRCRAGSYVPDGKGGRLLLFRAGAEFVELPPTQATLLQDWVDRRTSVPLAKGELRS